MCSSWFHSGSITEDSLPFLIPCLHFLSATLLVYFEVVSLYTWLSWNLPCRPGLELRDPPAPASRVPGLKVCCKKTFPVGSQGGSTKMKGWRLVLILRSLTASLKLKTCLEYCLLESGTWGSAQLSRVSFWWLSLKFLVSSVQIMVVGLPALCLAGMINFELCNPIHRDNHRLAESRMKMLLPEEFYITVSYLPPEPTWMNGHSAWLLPQNELSCHHLRYFNTYLSLVLDSVTYLLILTGRVITISVCIKNCKPSGLLPTYQELVIQIVKPQTSQPQMVLVYIAVAPPTTEIPKSEKSLVENEDLNAWCLWQRQGNGWASS